MILNEEKEMNEVNFPRMVKAYKYIQRELLTTDGDLFLTVDSLITLNNIITNSNSILLRQTNVKPAGYNKQYMHFNYIDNFNFNYIYQTIIFILFILLDRILNSNSIVNNGNILTDSKWRCYYETGKRQCRRLI